MNSKCWFFLLNSSTKTLFSSKTCLFWSTCDFSTSIRCCNSFSLTSSSAIWICVNRILSSNPADWPPALERKSFNDVSFSFRYFSCWSAKFFSFSYVVRLTNSLFVFLFSRFFLARRLCTTSAHGHRISVPWRVRLCFAPFLIFKGLFRHLILCVLFCISPARPQKSRFSAFRWEVGKVTFPRFLFCSGCARIFERKSSGTSILPT